MSNTIFICATAWNISVVPKEYADLFMAQVECMYKESDSYDAWDEMRENMLAMAADMKETYPGGDCVITGHELEELTDGQMSLELDAIPLDVAVAAMRENS